MGKNLNIRGGTKFKGTINDSVGNDILTLNSTNKQIEKIDPIDSSLFLSSSLPNAKVFIGNNLNQAIARTLIGDITIDNTGLTILSSNIITNSHIKSNAAISYSKLNLSGGIINSDISTSAAISRNKIANGNINKILINNNSGVFSEQISITPNRVLISDSLGLPIDSGITTTILNYLDVTSSIQTQLNNRLFFSSTIVPVQGDILYYNTGIWNRLGIGTSGQFLSSTGSVPTWTTTPNGLPIGGTLNQYLKKNSNTDYDTSWHTLAISDISGITATTSQINVLTTGFYDATSSVQTQFGSKLNNALANNALFVGNSSNQAGQLASGANGQVLTVVAGVPQWQTISGTGTVTSVAFSGASTGLTVTGSPITTNGTITLAGTLVELNGGTGQSTYTIGDLLYSSATNVLSKLPISTNGYILTISGGLPVWQVNSGSVVLTTKGDIFTFDTANQRLAVGTNGYVLTADSTQATGIKWALPVSEPFSDNIAIIKNNLDNTKLIKFDASNITTGTTRTYTFSDYDGTVALLGANNGAVLSRINDTNISLTLDSGANTALLTASTLTLGWTGTLADARISSSTNWNTAYSNRINSLTVIGSSGSATLVSNILNIPTYTLSGLGGFSNPMTTLGDIIYEDVTPVAARLAGNITTTRKFLNQTGTGTVSAVPSWNTLVSGDIPNNAANTTGSSAKWTTARNLAGNSVDGSTSVAFTNAFIVQGISDTGLSGAQFLGALGTGIVKNTTTTGILSIAIASDFPTLNQNTTGTAAGWTTGRTLSITGDIAYTSTSFDGTGNVTAAGTLTTVNSNVGTYGSATKSVTATVNGKGLVTAISEQTVTPAVGSITGLGTGVSTWLATPSWTNFNSAITGTAPYWATSGSTTITTPTLVGNPNFQGVITNTATWTATISNQYGLDATQTASSRATTSDLIGGYSFNSILTASAGSINLQGGIFNFTPIAIGGVSTLNNSGASTSQGGNLSAMTGGTYTNIPGTSSNGTSALFTVVVSNSTTFTSITATTAGSGYRLYDGVTFYGSQFAGTLNGGNGGTSNGSVTFAITAITGTNSFTSSSSSIVSRNNLPDLRGVPKNLISMRNASNTEIGNFSIKYTTTSTNLNTRGIVFSDYNGEVWQSSDNTSSAIFTLNRGMSFGANAVTGTSTITLSGTTTSFIQSGAISSSSAFAFSGTQLNTGSSSSGQSFLANPAQVKFSSTGTVAVFTNGFSFSPTLGTGNFGVITKGSITNAGSGYTDGTYSAVTSSIVSSTNGTGNATLIVTVSGGVVSSVSISGATLSVSRYQVNDIITVTSAQIGGTGSGFQFTITEVDGGNGSWMVGFKSSGSFTDEASKLNYVNFLANPTYNITSAQGGLITGLLYNPTITSVGSFSHRGIVIVPSILNSFGTTTPTATVDIRGSGSNPTLKTVGAGTGTNYSYRAFQSDGSTPILNLQDNGNFSVPVAASLSGFGTSSQTSTLESGGSFGTKTSSVNTNTTLDSTYFTVRVDASGANRTITLPSASGDTGRIYVILKSDSSANTVTISTTAGGDKVINTQYSGYMVQSNGTSYNVISSF